MARYELINEIEERVSGSYSPSPGVIYPTLLMLEEFGHTTATDFEGKKRYAITPAGLAYIAENREAVETALGVMDDARSAYGNGPAPQILRAMESLKMALRMRYERSPLTEEQSRSIAAAIDVATVALERIISGFTQCWWHVSRERSPLAPGEMRVAGLPIAARRSGRLAPLRRGRDVARGTSPALANAR